MIVNKEAVGHGSIFALFFTDGRTFFQFGGGGRG